MQDAEGRKKKFAAFADTLAATVRKGDRFDRAVYEPSEIIRQEHAIAMQDRLRELLPGQVVIYEDLAAYDDFAGLLHSVIDKMFEELPEGSGDSGLLEELLDARDQYEDDVDGLKEILHCLAENVLTETGTGMVLILTHFEMSADQWERHDYGYMRALSGWRNAPSLLLYSDRPVCEVSEMPDGNSPFYNVFDEDGSMLTEIDYE